MAPEADLNHLLKGIEPQLQSGIYLFCAVHPDRVGALPTPRLVFLEPEGATIVVSLHEAQANGLEGVFPCQWIVLGAHSDLAAVGFLAAIIDCLADAGISANVVSAFHHDHLFVPAGQGVEVVGILEELQARHQRGS